MFQEIFLGGGGIIFHAGRLAEFNYSREISRDMAVGLLGWASESLCKNTNLFEIDVGH